MENQNYELTQVKKFVAPTKTKIASGILVCVGLIVAAYSLHLIMYTPHLLSLGCSPNDHVCYNVFIDMYLGILLLFGAGGLAIGKKIGWWFGISSMILFGIAHTFVLISIFSSDLTAYVPLLLVFIAFLFLILDQKNYFAAIETAKNKLK